MLVEIVTPEKKMFSGKVDLIQLPGISGSFEILKNHAPLISTLDRGVIKIKTAEGQEELFEVEGGVVECKKNIVTVLAD